MSNKKKKKGAGAKGAPVLPFKPLAAGKKRRPLLVFYPSGTVQRATGEFLGLLPCVLTGSDGKETTEELPTIRLAEPWRETGGPRVYSNAERSVSDPIVAAGLGEPQRLTPEQTAAVERATPRRTEIPAGDTLSFPRYCVIADPDASAFEHVLYAPPVGVLAGDPLWPAKAIRRDEFPTPVPHVTCWRREPRRIRYFAPDGTTGALTGYFGFEVALRNPRETISAGKGVIPGAPAVLLTEAAPLPEGAGFPGVTAPVRWSREVRALHPTNPALDDKTPTRLLKAGTMAEIPFDWVVLDEEEAAVVYWPPSVAHVSEDRAWPGRVVADPRFPSDAVFAGTALRVAENREGPPVEAAKPGHGFAGFLPEEEIRFGIEQRTRTTPLGFSDAERIRSAYVALFRKHTNESARFVAMRHGEEWSSFAEEFVLTAGKEVNDSLRFVFHSIPEALEQADIVLWDPDLAAEACGENLEIVESWEGKEFPARLLSETSGPQFHMMSRGTWLMDEPEALEKWGLDRPAYFTGWLLAPLNYTDEKLDYPEEWGRAFRPTPDAVADGRLGMYAAFFFMPVPPDATPDEKGVVWTSDADAAFFRVRWLSPLELNGTAKAKGPYAQVAALLDFMTSERVERNPVLWDGPDEEPRPARRRPAVRRPPSRCLVLRRIVVDPAVLAADGVEPATRGPLEEAHLVVRHTRTVRYGPGRRYTREVVVEPHRSPRNPTLPLRDGEEERIAAAERGEKEPRHIRVAR